MNLNQWAIKWGVPFDAVEDLRREFQGIPTFEPKVNSTDASESNVQSRVRLEASRRNCRLWRNNVGAYPTKNGGFVRYGLANETKSMNDVTKSSDLIGIKPVRIEQCHVGSVMGVFVARETKHGGWRYSGDNREIAQLNFMKLIVALGGDACFTTGEGTL